MNSAAKSSINFGSHSCCCTVSVSLLHRIATRLLISCAFILT